LVRCEICLSEEHEEHVFQKVLREHLDFPIVTDLFFFSISLKFKPARDHDKDGQMVSGILRPVYVLMLKEKKI